jgi:hypothetical protein
MGSTSTIPNFDFNQYGSDIFNAFDDLPTDWTAMNPFMQGDTMGEMDYPSIFTI